MIRTIEEAIAEQRVKIGFPVQKMSEFLYGAKEFVEMSKYLEKMPEMPLDWNIFNRGRVELIKHNLRDFPKLYNAISEKLHDNELTYMLFSVDRQLPGTVHLLMFIKTIQLMGTEQQFKEYYQKSMNFDIFGCYAQTELGHGSDVKELLTTATLDLEKDQFIIDTPCIEAAKFWPGELGLLATHALVLAQLIIKGKRHGVYPFIVPIRDQERKPLEGIEIGDIGPKIGFHTKDNGYMILHNVRIPRGNMLRKYIDISPKGKIMVQGNPKVGYATMMENRRAISCIVPKLYSIPITVATRYSIFRRQFKNQKKEEIKILDYQLQQQKITHRIAEYFAFSIAGRKIIDLSVRNTEAVLKQNSFKYLNETHATICLGKAFISEIVYKGMETCRKACGGHGFSSYSGFPAEINEYAAHNTHQGENTVMYLQVARFLLKCYKNHVMKQQSLGETVKYLESYDYFLSKKCTVDDPSKWSTDDLRVVLAQGVCYVMSVVNEKFLTKEEGVSDEELWNMHGGVRLQELAIMHSVYFTYNCFHEAIILERSEEVREVVLQVCKLYGVNQILTHSGPIIEGGFLTHSQLADLIKLNAMLLKSLRSNLIGLVDSFAIPEKFIRSALAKGNPYQNFFKLARECDLNQQRLQSVDIVLGVKNALKVPKANL